MKNSVFNTFGYSFGIAVAGFIFNVVIAKYLGARQYGEIVYDLSFVNLVALVIGMNYMALYMGERIVRQSRNAFSLFATIETTLFLIIIVPAYILMRQYIEKTENVVLILVIGYLMSIVMLGALEFNARKEISTSILIANVLPKFALIVLFLAAIIVGVGSPTIYLYIMGLSYLTVFLYILYRFQPKMTWSPTVLTRVWKFYLLGILGSGFAYLANILQKEYAGYDQLAMLSLVLLFFSGLSLVGSTLVKFILPKVHELYREKNFTKIHNIYRAYTSIETVIVFPIIVFCIVYIDKIAIVLGEGYASLPIFFYILSIGFIFDFLTGISGHLLRSMMQEKYEIINELVRIVVGLTIIVLCRNQAYGVAIALTITMIIYNVMKAVELYMLFGFLALHKKDFFFIVSIGVILFAVLSMIDTHTTNLFANFMLAVAVTLVSYLIGYAYLRSRDYIQTVRL